MTAFPCLLIDEVEMPVAKFFLPHETLAPVEVHFGIHAMAGGGISAGRYTQLIKHEPVQHRFSVVVRVDELAAGITLHARKIDGYDCLRLENVAVFFIFKQFQTDWAAQSVLVGNKREDPFFILTQKF